MSDLKRVAELAGQLMTVSVHSDDDVLSVEIDIDSCNLFEEDHYISIGSLNGSELTISEDDIVSVEDNKVKLRNYTLVF